MVVQYYRYIIQFLVLVSVGVWIAVFQLPDNNLHIIACDVGQGDAILVVYKNIQILTDGGPNNKVLNCLSKYMPFWDREIELVILTHPDADHSTGLIDVIRRYNVGTFLNGEVGASTEVYEVLESEVGSRGIPTITPSVDKRISMGLIYLDILHPFEGLESKNTNDYSIVYKLSYGKFKAIFTGDIEQSVSDSLVNNYLMEYVDYIKIPHHGSKNGITLNLLKAAMPKIAVISVGAKNQYGHPHEEVLKILSDKDIKILRTDLEGDVVVETDGKKFWVND